MDEPTKRGVVLCPGPSLAAALPELRLQSGGQLRSYGGGEFDISVAVNRAAKDWPADYWSMLDAESFDDVTPAGSPTIVIAERGLKKLSRKHPDVTTGFNIVLREDLAAPPKETRWYRWSATVGVVTAWTFGAREIVVYGADLAGVEDYDGSRLKRHHRNERRWIRERAAWLALGDWLEAQGVKLRRVSAGKTDKRKDVA